jgi:hypothetical protein
MSLCVCLDFGAADGRTEVCYDIKWHVLLSQSTASCPVSWIRVGDVRVILHT